MTIIKGVTDLETEIIKNILSPFLKKYHFYFFGSRTKANFRKLSDLDILIKGSEEANPDEIDNLKHLFDNSSLPYIVNIVDYHRITPEFYELIKSDLKLIEMN